MGAIKPRDYPVKTLYLAHLFRALANPLRIEMIHFIQRNGEVRNIDITREFQIARSTCKEHLSFMLDAALIEVEYKQHYYLVRIRHDAQQNLKSAFELLQIEPKRFLAFPA